MIMAKKEKPPLMYETEPKRCGAKTRKDGHPCQRWAMPNGRCNLHGGKSLAGPASPRWQHGKRSKYVPNRLLKHYHASLQDEEMLDLRDEIALVDAQIADVLSTIDTTISDVQWQNIVGLWLDFMNAVKAGDNERQIELVYLLDDVIDAGTDYRTNMVSLNDLIDRRSRLVTNQIKNQATSQQMLGLEIVIALLAKVVMATKEAALEYADPEIAKKIIMATNVEFKKIVGSPEL